jgi:hypothetical protein
VQLLQLLLGGVVGGLQRLGPLSRVPHRGAQAWSCQTRKKLEEGCKPSKGKPAKQELNSDLPSTCFRSISKARRPASTACSRPLMVLPCSWRASSWPVLVMLSTISSPSSSENLVFRSSSDICAASRAAHSLSRADRASARAASSW